jgi:hypothetical protein
MTGAGDYRGCRRFRKPVECADMASRKWTGARHFSSGRWRHRRPPRRLLNFGKWSQRGAEKGGIGDFYRIL